MERNNYYLATQGEPSYVDVEDYCTDYFTEEFAMKREVELRKTYKTNRLLEVEVVQTPLCEIMDLEERAKEELIRLNAVLDDFQNAKNSGKIREYFDIIIPASANIKEGIRSVDLWVLEGFFNDAIIARIAGFAFENPIIKYRKYLDMSEAFLRSKGF